MEWKSNVLLLLAIVFVHVPVHVYGWMRGWLEARRQKRSMVRNSENGFNFRGLPPEIRNMIYELVLVVDEVHFFNRHSRSDYMIVRRVSPDGERVGVARPLHLGYNISQHVFVLGQHNRSTFTPALLRTNRATYLEAITVLYRENYFIFRPTVDNQAFSFLETDLLAGCRVGDLVRYMCIIYDSDPRYHESSRPGWINICSFLARNFPNARLRTLRFLMRKRAAGRGRVRLQIRSLRDLRVHLQMVDRLEFAWEAMLMSRDHGYVYRVEYWE
ncbi:hypothetical protein L228DRAFT_270692 [Xylona heveae TC161]|uniref:DUF7730 domain-containing protein n=1 Tax=Xylona heveae (strain CBS 132557 / TC161) TaxID=1328760 RepID=A0A165A444_XYLHT|nr:hypothetical protein L228DRAFT_270692 [Xylona heveae TC161]KZF19925.1 hypothetical protein L228DRAFT_270692 [Xylona heveae TC161]